jgi:hypothetical protein
VTLPRLLSNEEKGLRDGIEFKTVKVVGRDLAFIDEGPTN